MNSLKRVQEYQADRIACDITGDPVPLIEWFNRMSIRERQLPNDLVSLLLNKHPSSLNRAKRIQENIKKSSKYPSLKPL